jgi:hypothetical protein
MSILTSFEAIDTYLIKDINNIVLQYSGFTQIREFHILKKVIITDMIDIILEYMKLDLLALYAPLVFWSNTSPRLALPLVALQYNTIKFTLI